MNDAGPHDLLDRRRSGVLLHPTSLPGPFDNGVFGRDAERFVDFLQRAGFSVWQVLPLGPVDASLSPYTVSSVFAGNPRMVDLAMDPSIPWRIPDTLLDRTRQWTERGPMLVRTYSRFQRLASETERRAFHTFTASQRHWLGPFVLFQSLKERFDRRPWWRWPASLRQREPDAIRKAKIAHRRRMRQIAFEQFLFWRQWRRLKHYANQRGIYMFGDLPIYVDRDSVDVWWRPELFRIDRAGRPIAVAGVPPDYFSQDGQLWGNPIYDWDRMREHGFVWWIERLRHQLNQFDLLRIDHFRALESYWEVPAGSKTARNGQWRTAPGGELLEAIDQQLGALHALVAEDLGRITPEVTALRDRFGLPGMLVLQFAFDGSPDNPFLPENHVEHAVAYTGTHDNDTTLGWYGSLENLTREFVDQRLGIPGNSMPDALIREALASPARLAVIPMQDLLRLGSEHRMNTPGTSTGNWRWRFDWTDLDPELGSEYLGRNTVSGRI